MINKRTTLHIQKRRDIAFSAYVPPKTPDEEEEGGGPPDPTCLPLCEGVGAGLGTGYGATGAERRTITQCSACDNYFRTESEYLGRGDTSLDGDYHCGSCGAHDRGDHQTRLFVDYLQVPQSEFRLRARLYWDDDTTNNMAVRVYGNVAELPAIDLDDCEDDLSVWGDGDYLGSIVFVADSFGTLGTRDIQYQELPSDLVVDGAALSTTKFRFQLDNSVVTANAKFKAANIEMVVD